jgi:hypothetical protein
VERFHHHSSLCCIRGEQASIPSGRYPWLVSFLLGINLSICQVDLPALASVGWVDGLKYLADFREKMSDNILKIIPVSPDFVPLEKSKTEAIDFITGVFRSTEITCKIFESPRFIDQGSNIERIICPRCHSVIDDAFWQNAMNIAYENKFRNLLIKTPCCGEEISLNDLQYEWPAGFACFLIEIRNPGDDLTDFNLEQLEKDLGTPLRKIWAHY